MQHHNILTKKANIVGKKQISLSEEGLCNLDPSDVIIKMHYCGICGSDIPRYFEGRVRKFPIVLGHEFCGEIVATGCEVVDLAIGAKVVGVPLQPCNKCEYCKRGDYSLCKEYKFIGSSLDGAMTTYMVINRKNVFEVDKSLKSEDCVYFETATVALHAINKVTISSKQRVAIVGSGTIGILIAQWAKIKNAKCVHIYGRRDQFRNEEELSLLGINYYNYNKVQDYNKYDIVFDAAGESETLSKSLELIRSKGILVNVGTPKHEIVLAANIWEKICRKEITITGSWMGYSQPFPGKEWTETLEAIRSNELILSSMLTYRIYNLDEISDAFGCFESEKVTGRIVIKMEN